MNRRANHILGTRSVGWLLRCSALCLLPALFGSPIAAQSKKEKLEQAVELDRQGVRLGKQGNFEGAIDKFGQARTILDETTAWTYHNLGTAHSIRGEKEKALENFDRAVLLNPNLVPSLAAQGKLAYELGQYQKAVLAGERALKLDPKNKQVPEWLPDARKKLTETGEPDTAGTIPASLVPVAKTSFETSFWGQWPLSFNRNTNQLKTRGQLGPLIHAPYGFTFDFYPEGPVFFKLLFENPNYGPVNPAMISHREKLSILYKLDDLYFGAGILAAQLNPWEGRFPEQSENFIHTAPAPEILDSKLGAIFGSRLSWGSFEFQLFPRLMQGESGKKVEGVYFDMNELSLEFDSAPPRAKVVPQWAFSWQAGARLREIYILESQTRYQGKDQDLSHYFGYLDLYFGLHFGDVFRQESGFPFDFGFRLTERIYFRDQNETDVYAFGNGQGFFGFDTSGAIEGEAFSGLRSTSHIIAVVTRQLLPGRVMIQEEFSYEFSASDEKFSQFISQFLIGYRY